MSTNSINALAVVTEAPHAAAPLLSPSASPSPPLATVAAKHEPPPIDPPPIDPPPMDWRHAVDAAAARLNESWVRPDTTGFMVASGLAGELAATLSAYGMTAAEAAHMRGRLDRALAAMAAQVLKEAAAAALTTPAAEPK